jgi:hypothetical protein
MAGSDTMLIHLGKVYLGQTDKVDVTTRGAPTVVYVERVNNPRDRDLKRNPDGSFVLNDRGAVVKVGVEDNGFSDGRGDRCNGMRHPATN